MKQSQIKCKCNNRSGFSLIEILMSMFILSIGLIAIASVFPVSIYFQQQAFDEIISRQVTASIESELCAKGIREADLLDGGNGLPNMGWVYLGAGSGGYDSNGKVYPLPGIMFEVTTSPVGGRFVLGDRWPITQRCYPTIDPHYPNGYFNPNTGNRLDMGISADLALVPGADYMAIDREFYWVPFVVDRDMYPGQRSWEVIVFVLRKMAGTNYPNKTVADGNYANPDDPIQIPGVRLVPASLDFDVTRFATSSQLNANRIIRVELALLESAVSLQIGDRIMTDDGRVYSILDTATSGTFIYIAVDGVVDSNIDGLWYGVRANDDSRSPTVGIFVLDTGGRAVVR